MQLHVTSTAQGDLEEIFFYWAQRVTPETADRVIDRIVERFQLLAAYPRVGRRCPEIVSNMRCFPAGKYLMYFKASAKYVQILHVFHGARDQTRALEGDTN